jgi:hypothetical protein
VKKLLIPLGIALATAASGAWAKAPADATGECKDGTYTTSASKEGACSSHGGVKKWTAKEDKSSSKSSGASTKAAKEDKPASAKSSKTAAAEKPANATGECKDGTYTDAASKSGACSGHKGVKTWYGASSSGGSSKSSKESSKSSAGGSSSMGGSSSSMGGSTSSMGSASPSKSTPKSTSASAAGGGNGKVWVNTDSKVYHCESDALYGKTKQGEYMTESQAKASGARPSRGKECA